MTIVAELLIDGNTHQPDMHMLLAAMNYSGKHANLHLHSKTRDAAEGATAFITHCKARPTAQREKS